MMKAWRTSSRSHLLSVLLLGTLGACLAGESEAPCEVVVKSYMINAEPSYMSGTKEPTVTPVPRNILGLVDFNVKSTGSSDIKVCLVARVISPGGRGFQGSRT